MEGWDEFIYYAAQQDDESGIVGCVAEDVDGQELVIFIRTMVLPLDEWRDGYGELHRRSDR